MNLIRLLYPPRFEHNEEKSRAAFFLHIILITVILSLTAVLIVRELMPVNSRILTVIILLGLIGISFILLIIVRFGYVRQASFVLVLLGWLAMTLLAFNADGVRDITVMAYIVLIFIATLLLDWRYAMVFTIMSIAAIWILAVLENKQIIYPSFDDVFNYSRDFTAILVLLSSLIFLYSRSLKISIEKVTSQLRERKQMELKLRQSENAYRTLFEKSPLGVATVRLSGEFTDINEKFCLLTGLSREEIIGKNADELGIVDYSLKHKIKKELILQGGTIENFEFVFKNKQEKYQHLILAANIIKLNNEPFIIIMLQDISERRRVERALKLSELKFKEAFLLSPIAIIITERDTGKLIEVNETFLNLSGFKREEVIGKSILELGFWVNLNERESVLARINKYKIVKSLESEFMTRSGQIVTMLYSTALMEEVDKTYIVTTLLDITERKKAVEALVESEKQLKKQNVAYYRLNEALKIAASKAEESDKLKTAFLQNMSHEIRSPMNAIIGFSELLAEPYVTQEEIGKYTEAIITSSRQLLSVVSDILTISSIETGQEMVNLSSVDINLLLKEMATMFKLQLKAKNLVLHSKPALPDSEAILLTDETKLIQIFTNLINNAVKFTHTGEIEIGYTLKDTVVQFYVRDTGIGIDTRMQHKIFERFKQADDSINKKYGGTGLGLAISKAHTELLGGRIWVESNPGEGSTFYFTLPFKEPVMEPLTEVSNEPGGFTLKGLILVVEDEDNNYKYIYEILTRNGMNVIRAENGKIAVDLCRENKSIDVVLMDIKMPVMNGYDALKIIKKFRPDLPVVGQSAYAFPKNQVSDVESGFDAYITKPIKVDILLEVLSKFLTQG